MAVVRGYETASKVLWIQSSRLKQPAGVTQYYSGLRCISPNHDQCRQSTGDSITRKMPDPQFPPFTYIPGRTPRGDRSVVELHRLVLDPDNWAASPHFQQGLRLFCHGYYWEAHEAWESVWLQLGRTGPPSDFVKGLIKFAAAGVKVLEGNLRGAVRHLARARELLSGSDHTELARPWLEAIALVDQIGYEPPTDFNPWSPVPIKGFTPELPTGWPANS